MSNKIKQDVSIGKNLKALRKSVKLSQGQVVIKLQLMGLTISREILSQMECGKYSIRVSIFMALKEIYNANYDDFFKDL